jgi:F-type H+-transporting ATPase subunit epsilon
MKLNIKIMNPDDIIYSGIADMITIPGDEGEFSVLPGHINIISMIKSGTIKIYNSGNIEKELSILSGYAKIENDDCVIIVH